MAAAILVPLITNVVIPLLTSEQGEKIIAKIFVHHPHLKEKTAMINPAPNTAANAVFAHLAAAQAALQTPQPAAPVVAEPAPAAPAPVVETAPAPAPAPVEVPQVATTAPGPVKATAGAIVDTVLHDVILTGILAASIFVKNPAHQQTAASLIQAVQQLLPVLDAQLNPPPAA